MKGRAAGSLERELGVFGATMLGLGSILGTGVFVSIGGAAAVAGPAVIVAIVLAAPTALTPCTRPWCRLYSRHETLPPGRLL